MNTVQYAQAGSSGALASCIGWIDFGQGVELSNTSPFINVTNLLPCGYVLSFDLSFQALSSAPLTEITYVTAATPTSPSAAFGNVDYTGIAGSTAIIGGGQTSTLTTVTLSLNNISLVDCSGCPVKEFLFVAADAAYTNATPPAQPSIWSLTSRSANWNQLQPIPAVNGAQEGGPQIDGIGTYTVTETGLVTAPEATMAHVFMSKSPREVMASATLEGAIAAFSFGIILLSDVCQPIKYVSQETINYIEPNKCWSQQISLPEGFMVTDAIYGDAPYPAGFGPIIIEGWLGVYVIIDNEIFIASYAELISQTYDFIILIAKRGEQLLALPVLFEYVENKLL